MSTEPATPAALPLDTYAGTVQPNVHKIAVESSGLTAQILQKRVTSKETHEWAVSTLRWCVDMRKALEKERKAATDPLTQVTERIRSWFRPVDAQIGEAEKHLRDQIAGYQQSITLANEAAMRAERLRNAAQGAAQVLQVLPPVQGGTSAATVLGPPQGPPPAYIERPHDARVRMVPVLDIQVTQPDLVPRHFCSPDMAKIRAAVQAGSEVPGVSVSRTVQTKLSPVRGGS